MLEKELQRLVKVSDAREKEFLRDMSTLREENERHKNLVVQVSGEIWTMKKNLIHFVV